MQLARIKNMKFSVHFSWLWDAFVRCKCEPWIEDLLESNSHNLYVIFTHLIVFESVMIHHWEVEGGVSTVWQNWKCSRNWKLLKYESFSLRMWKAKWSTSLETVIRKWTCSSHYAGFFTKIEHWMGLWVSSNEKNTGWFIVPFCIKNEDV